MSEADEADRPGPDGGSSRLGRSRLLAAQAEVSLALGRLDQARTAVDELEVLARDWQRRRGSETTVLHAVARSARRRLGPPLPFLPERWHGRPICGVVTCWTGPEDEDDRIRAWLDGLGPVLGQHVGRMPYPVINTLFDELVPAGLFHYWKGTFSRALPDGAIDAYVEHGASTPSIQSVTVVFPIDGACHRVGPEDTAFSYRDADFSTALSPTLTTREECEAQKDWVRGFYAALEPHSAGGGYVNFMDGDDQDRVHANYRGNYARLTDLKRRYDPGNLFRLNHNIAP